jgi:Na+/melibiose symporter-like transporter
MPLKKRLLLKSMGFSLIITVLLMLISFLPVWEIMNETEKTIFPFYGLLSSGVVFCILTIIFYFDIRRILERKSD